MSDDIRPAGYLRVGRRTQFGLPRARRKPYGLKLGYIFGIALHFETRWYASEEARAAAAEDVRKNSASNFLDSVEEVQR